MGSGIEHPHRKHLIGGVPKNFPPNIHTQCPCVRIGLYLVLLGVDATAMGRVSSVAQYNLADTKEVVHDNRKSILDIRKKSKSRHIHTNVTTLPVQPTRMYSINRHLGCYHGCYRESRVY